MSHTKEPWIVTGGERIKYIEARIGNGMLQEIASCMVCEQGELEANARRIVACVNACAGISTELLEKVNNFSKAAALQVIADHEYMEQLERQNAELVEVLNKYGDHRPSCTFYPSDPDMIDPLSNQCTCGLEQALAAQKVSA